MQSVLPERKRNIALCAHVDHHLAEMPPSLEVRVGGRSFVEREDLVDGRGDLVDVDEADKLLEHRAATGRHADQTLCSADERANVPSPPTSTTTSTPVPPVSRNTSSCHSAVVR